MKNKIEDLNDKIEDLEDKINSLEDTIELYKNKDQVNRLNDVLKKRDWRIVKVDRGSPIWKYKVNINILLLN